MSSVDNKIKQQDMELASAISAFVVTMVTLLMPVIGKPVLGLMV